MTCPTPRKKGLTLVSVFVTFFLDSLSATIVYPLFAPLFLSDNSKFLNSSLTFSSKAALLGLFLALYPFFQMITSPALGTFADRYGRKKGFVVTTLVSCLGYALCALSVEIGDVVLLFFSRLLMGASGSNVSLCLSSLSDISSSTREKTKWYTLGSLVAGLSFVLGPLVGGKLADPALHPLFKLSFPLWIGSVFSFFNFLGVVCCFKETKHKAEKSTPFSAWLLLQEINQVFEAIKKGSLKKVFLMYFFYLLTWNMIFQFVPAFLVSNFSAKTPLIGDICALLGVSWILGNVILYKVLLSFFRKKTILCASGALLSAFVFLSFFASNIPLFTAELSLAAFFASLCWPLCTSVISDQATPLQQGKLMGLTQSFQSLAMLVAPFIIGPFIAKDSIIPFSIASAFGLVFVLLTFLTRIEE